MTGANTGKRHSQLTIRAASEGGYVVTSCDFGSMAPTELLFAGKLDDCLTFIDEAMVRPGHADEAQP